ncbi:NfeD family protein [bacterium]|nr:NfeD family protein [bacterium]
MWQILLVVSFVCLILEMFIPTTFFLNFALAGFICAILSLYISNEIILLSLFCLFSVICIFTLRPLLIKKSKNKALQTGMQSKYIGKRAKVIEETDKTKGAISIYDERWQARNAEDGTISVNSEVEIVDFESIVMKVKEIK